MQKVDDEQQTVTRLRRTVAVFAIVLFASTWRLWTPQTVFPQIPLFMPAGRLPNWVDWLEFGAMLVSMATVLFAPRSSRWWRLGCAIFVGSFVVMVLIDQHRLQPWAYQFALVAVALALAPDSRGLALARLLTIGIYFHSALSKLDFSFIETHGQYLVGGLLNPVGIELGKWSPFPQRALAAALPIGELLVAVGLCFRATRRIALVVAIAMHGLLIAALGPWSLDHEFAVLLWNAYFIAQDVLLFARSGERTTLAEFVKRAASQWKLGVATCVIAMAVVLPFLEPFGLFDPWPSWALYASRPARTRVFIDSDARDELPSSLQPYVQEARFSDGLCPVRIDRWSLDATHAPVYPSERFELGVALALTKLPGMENTVHVELESPADRWTGIRTVRRISGAYELRVDASLFFFDAVPRGTTGD